MKMSLRRKIFYGATLAFVATLLLLPATGWLARIQLMPWTFLPFINGFIRNGNVANDDLPTGNDFDLRYAAALSAGSKESVKKLEALNRDVPNNVLVHAALLRMLAADTSSSYRPEEGLLEPATRRKDAAKHPAKPYQPMPNAARIVEVAEAGEKIEPNNGFFPTMVAVGYFGQKRDVEAIAAWRRAGAAPRFDDYSMKEATGKWKLAKIRYGTETGAMAQMAQMAAITFPHYARIRGAARMASVMAMQAEVAGNTEEGFEIRRASRQIGSAMQHLNGSFIGNLVGTAVGAIAMNRAGGAETLNNPYTKGDDEKNGERWAKEKHQNYAAYLRGIGHPEEASAFLATTARGDALRKIWRTGSPKTYSGFGETTFRWMFAWVGNILTLAGAIFALGFAGIFAVIYKFSPRLQKNQPLQKSAQWGVWMGFVVPAFAAVTIGLEASKSLVPDYLPLVVIGVGILTLVASPLALRLSAKEVRHGVGVMLATILCGAFIGGIAGAVVAVAAAFGSSAQMLTGAMYGSENGETFRTPLWLVLMPVIFAGVMASLPVVMLALFALFSRVLKIPVAAGVTRGTRSAAVPLAALLLLVWGGCLFNTLRHENAAIAEMKRITEIGEIRAIAELTAQPYPL